MKVHLARELVHINVDEFDFQANVGFLRSGMDTEFATEIRAIVEAADGRPVKSMSESGLLSEEQQIRCIRIAEAGVAFVKNSSGVGPGGSPATPRVIRFMRTHLRAEQRSRPRAVSRQGSRPSTCWRQARSCWGPVLRRQ